MINTFNKINTKTRRMKVNNFKYGSKQVQRSQKPNQILMTTITFCTYIYALPCQNHVHH